MVVYAEFEIPASDLRIGRAFGQLAGVEVEMDRIVPTGDAVIPFIWVSGADPDDVIRAARTDHALEHITVLDSHRSDSTLYRVVWNRHFRDTVVEISESRLALLSGFGTTETWRFEFRAPTKKPLREFQASLRAMDIESTVIRLSEADSELGRFRSRLTDSQLEALELAYERGYFDDARKVNLDPLAGEIGISRQAFSGRLRRGMYNILGDMFGDANQ